MRIIIIGAGPGGYETALEAAKRGIEVVLISDGPLGGTCLNAGCIPTKTLCHFAESLEDGGDLLSDSELSDIMSGKSEVIGTLSKGIATLMSHKLITLVEGQAHFKDAHTVSVGDSSFEADYIIIATGSVSASLPIPGADLESVIDSEKILSLQSVPPRLCVIGGGVIGLEFASIFRRFGSEVTVLEYCKELLPRFDTDLSKRLKQALGKRGIVIETSAQVTAIEESDGECHIRYTKRDTDSEVLADKVLISVGRKPAVSSLNLSEAGVEFTPRGIVVNENMQTSVPSIYAIGDVTGGMMLAHVATFQGLRALNHICGHSDRIRFDIVPAAVFTLPEVAVVGKSEDDCKSEGIIFKSYKSFFRANGKALSMGEPEGYCKLLADEGGKILGCHIMGAHASDLIQEIASLMNFDATVSDLSYIIHAHPTLSEVILNAVR